MRLWPWGRRAARAGSWWAEDDLPVRDGCHVTPLVDGHAAMLAMGRAFLGARRYILLAGWDIRADLPMVRGDDVRAGADGAPEQRALLAGLREAGLDDAALAFWGAGQLRVADVLGFAASRGVQVGVLLWDAFHLGSHLTNDPTKERAVLERVGAQVLLDDSSRKIKHAIQSLHQKCAVVDGRGAFLGGVDLTREEDGDYDRWDTHGHLFLSPERTPSRGAETHPWHDVHARLEGPIVGDVQRNIVDRWREVAARHNGPRWPSSLPHPAPVSLPQGISAQIVRTIPPGTYAFARRGISTILDAYLGAIARARSFIYLESQYLWHDVFLGLDDQRWGPHSPQMTQVLEALAAAIERGVQVALVVPDHPNAGRRYTDGGVDFLRERARRAQVPERFDVLTLGNDGREPSAPDAIYYRPVYVHAKVAIVDDTWWTVGSANLNSRGMYSDAEINVAVVDGATAVSLRRVLWTEHAHPSERELALLDDPIEGLAFLRARAEANGARVRDRAPLDGHLLPYFTAAEGRARGLSIHQEHGWLDNLTGGAGALPEKYAHRYL